MIKKFLAGLIFGVVVLFAVPAAPALASPVAVTAAAAPVAQQAPAPPPGPHIDPAENEKANAEKTKSKVVVGVIAVVLAGIVVWGRMIRRKRKKDAS
jgi:CubicO group peptidase (beta-lactamase class C family)